MSLIVSGKSEDEIALAIKVLDKPHWTWEMQGITPPSSVQSTLERVVAIDGGEKVEWTAGSLDEEGEVYYAGNIRLTRTA